MKLNLGCSDRAVAGFVGVDIAPPADVIADLSRRWPWPDSSVSEVVAYDIIEHIADKKHFMNELHRVMAPGAKATIETPNACKGAGFWQDPDHRSGWVMNSFQYFEHRSFAHKRLAKAYGITAAFRILSLTEKDYQDVLETVWKIRAVLECVK